MRIFATRPFNSGGCLLEKRCVSFRAGFEIGKVIINQTFPVFTPYKMYLISILNKLKKIYHKTSVGIANLSVEVTWVAEWLLRHSAHVLLAGDLKRALGTAFFCAVATSTDATEAERPGRTIAPPQRGVELLIDRLWKLLVMSPRKTIRPKRALTSICMEVVLSIAFCDVFFSP